MDDLVLTGTLALIAFFSAIVISVIAGIFFFSWLWSAACTGDYRSMLMIIIAIIVAGCAYTGTGYYLLGKGWI